MCLDDAVSRHLWAADEEEHQFFFPLLWFDVCQLLIAIACLLQWRHGGSGIWEQDDGDKCKKNRGREEEEERTRTAAAEEEEDNQEKCVFKSCICCHASNLLSFCYSRTFCVLEDSRASLRHIGRANPALPLSQPKWYASSLSLSLSLRILFLLFAIIIGVLLSLSFHLPHCSLSLPSLWILKLSSLVLGFSNWQWNLRMRNPKVKDQWQPLLGCHH